MATLFFKRVTQARAWITNLACGFSTGLVGRSHVGFHQMNSAASAITTIVTITNAAICTQRLFARPLLCVI